VILSLAYFNLLKNKRLTVVVVIVIVIVARTKDKDLSSDLAFHDSNISSSVKNSSEGDKMVWRHLLHPTSKIRTTGSLSMHLPILGPEL
jgi:hypothetical protein